MNINKSIIYKNQRMYSSKFIINRTTLQLKLFGKLTVDLLNENPLY